MPQPRQAHHLHDITNKASTAGGTIHPWFLRMCFFKDPSSFICELDVLTGGVHVHFGTMFDLKWASLGVSTASSSILCVTEHYGNCEPNHIAGSIGTVYQSFLSISTTLVLADGQTCFNRAFFLALTALLTAIISAIASFYLHSSVVTTSTFVQCYSSYTRVRGSVGLSRASLPWGNCCIGKQHCLYLIWALVTLPGAQQEVSMHTG